jgi:hypothetical protein
VLSIRDEKLDVSRFRREAGLGSDGRRLLFTSERAIWMIDRDGANPRKLYSAAPCGLPPSLGVSADGHSIYASLTASNEEIWIADLPE